MRRTTLPNPKGEPLLSMNHASAQSRITVNITLIQTALNSIHSVFCLTTGPKPPLKRFLDRVWSRASSFKWEYPLLSLRSSSSFLRLLPRLHVTCISPFIFPSITCFRRQFLRKMWPIQLAFRFIFFLRSPNSKLLRQIKENSINNCDFSKNVISTRGGHCFLAPVFKTLRHVTRSNASIATCRYFKLPSDVYLKKMRKTTNILTIWCFFLTCILV